MGACFSCNDCGACKEGLPQIRPSKCPFCGKPIFMGDTQCASCGKELPVEDEQPVTNEG